MKRFLEKKYLVRQHLLSLVAVSLTFYFSYHLMQGHRSYPRLLTLQSKIENLEQEHEILLDKRKNLEARVIKMRPGSLDEDLVQERIRLVLGYRDRGEIDYILK